MLEEEVFVDHWQLIGPFRFDKEELLAPDAHTLPVGLNRDFLALFGLSETEITEERLLSLTKDQARDASVLAPDFGNFRYRIREIPKIDFTKVFDTPQGLVVYGAIAVESPDDRRIALALGSDDTMKLWCNNEPVVAERNTNFHGVKKYGLFASVELKKGRNFVVAKVAHKSGGWGLSARLLALDSAVEKAKHYGLLLPLHDRILAQDDLFSIDLDLYGQDFPGTLDIVDENDAVVHSEQFRYQRTTTQATTMPVPVLPKGLYTARLTFPMDTLETPVYFGDPFELRSAFRSRQGAAWIDPRKPWAQFGGDAISLRAPAGTRTCRSGRTYPLGVAS